MNSESWEALCSRCGLCCFEKRILGDGRVEITRTSCRHMDIVNRCCRVYAKRESVGENCIRLTPEIVLEADWLPEECAYRRLLLDTVER